MKGIVDKYELYDIHYTIKGAEWLQDKRQWRISICRGPTPGDGFLEALIEPIVAVHTNQIQRITENGFIAHDGTSHEVDVMIICATGFNTSWTPRFPVKAHGKNLQDIWKERGTISHLAVAVPEFPNLFSSARPVSRTILSLPRTMK